MKPHATFVVVRLRFDEAVVVAAPESLGEIDRPMAMEPLGDTAFVPMSSVIGSLREAARIGSAPADGEAEGDAETDVEALFGPLAADAAELRPSPVRGLGTRLVRGGKAIGRSDLEVRKQTAVDAHTGSALNRSLRSTTLVPAGAELHCYFELADVGLLERFGRVIRAWRPRLGAGSSVGLGAATVVDVRSRQFDLSVPDDVRDLFAAPCSPQRLDEIVTDEIPMDEAVGGSVERRSWSLEVDSPLLVSPESAESENDPGTGQRRVNTVGSLRRGNQYVIDGSSLKGLVRHRVHFILSSLCSEFEGVDEASAKWAVETLFGSTERVGVFRFARADIADAHDEQRHHVAIDRVSGGARDGLMFTDRPVVRGRLEIAVEATGDVPRWGWPLIEAAVRDVGDGLVGVGHATSRGYGSLRWGGSALASVGLGEAVALLVDEWSASRTPEEE